MRPLPRLLLLLLLLLLASAAAASPSPRPSGVVLFLCDGSAGRLADLAHALASLDAAVEDRQAEARQKHAAELKSVRLRGSVRCRACSADAALQMSKKTELKVKQLEKDIARIDASEIANAQVKSTLELLLSRM